MKQTVGKVVHTAFSSVRENIETTCKGLSTGSLYFGGGIYNAKGIAKSYCNDYWGECIVKTMTELYRDGNITDSGMITGGGSNNFVNPGNFSNIIFVGDSRTYGMQQMVSANPNELWICQSGMSYDWFTQQYSRIESNIRSGTAIVVLMGANDIWGLHSTSDPAGAAAQKYITALNSKSIEWKSKGATTFFVSVNPTADTKKYPLANVISFNSTMSSQLNGVGYIDTYTEMKSTLDSTNDYTADGLHYGPNTYKKIYELVKEKISNGSTSSNSGSSSSSTSNGKATGQQMVEFARQYVGKIPYIWGGASLETGADCSGFVGQVLAHFGFVPQEQADVHAYIDTSYRTMGTEVPSLAEAQAGDIICYNGHVAMYDGEGKIVEAKGKNYGITNDRPANYGQIYAIRRFTGSVGSSSNNNLNKYTYVAKVAKLNYTSSSTQSGDTQQNSSSGNMSMSLETIDYRKYVSGYDVPYNYILALMIVGHDSSFMSDFIKLVRNSVYIIGITDTETVSTNTYTVTHTHQDLKPNARPNPGTMMIQRPAEGLTGHEITSAPTPTPTPTPIPSQKPPTNVVTYTTTEQVTTTSTSYTLKDELIIADSWCARYNFKTKKVEEKTDDEHAPNFVTLLKKHYPCRTNLLSADYYLFKILESNEDTKDMVDLTKYLLYKATGVVFDGITTFDFSLFGAKPTTSGGSGRFFGGTFEEKLWFALLDAGYSKECAAGALGNFFCESGVRSNNLQNTYETSLGYSDESYTQAVDNGSYSNFANDSAGYGLCQWTTSDRKKGLYQLTKSKNVSIADEDSQIEYMLGETGASGYASGFASTISWSYKGYTKSSWTSATTPEEAAKAFSYWFESPEVYNGTDREPKAREYYEKFKDMQRPTFMTEPLNTSDASSDGWVRGTIALPNGKRATVFNQCAIPGWGSCCNRAAAAIICSVNTDNSLSSSRQIVTAINHGTRQAANNDVPSNDVFGQYGLKVDQCIRYGAGSSTSYIDTLRNHLKNGGYAMIWVYAQGGNAHYFGVSGTRWTSGDRHWFPILGYNERSDMILIADWGKNGWWSITEFSQYGAYDLILISEK